ncbi:MAG: hypothetical protein AAGA28_14380 [Pseudomonadota bacterium]
MPVVAERMLDGPIIGADPTTGFGANVNGPSLIRVPDWIRDPLGRYYLYFAHHLGGYIRLAYADALRGPWKIHDPGVLHLSHCPQFHDHIASPDVHVDDETRSIRMYFHGVSGDTPPDDPPQSTSVAISHDGLAFQADPLLLGDSYFRVWQGRLACFAVSLSGVLWRSATGTGRFERGVRLSGLPESTRHLAVTRRGGHLWFAWSVIGDCPERIFIGRVDEAVDWRDWALSDVQELLRPDRPWEGADAPLLASRVGMASERVHQLRDPAFFAENGTFYLIYSVAGESGLALARLHFEGAMT